MKAIKIETFFSSLLEHVSKNNESAMDNLLLIYARFL